MRHFSPLYALIAVCVIGATLAYGQVPGPQVDKDEILRLGDHVDHHDGIRSDGEAGFMAAMAPPANDSDKWFLSFFSSRHCAPCPTIKGWFSTSPHLRALANPRDQRSSWSHWNEYLAEDTSQTWRFRQLHIEQYPTIVVQAPLSGKFGRGGTVVFQDTPTPNENPEQLAGRIRSAIATYCENLQRGPTPVQPGPQAPPPFVPAPREEEYGPSPFSPPDGPVLPAAPIRIPPLPAPAPAVAPVPTPAPPADSPAGDQEEIVIIHDARRPYTEAQETRVEAAVKKLRERHKDARVRHVDWDDAKNRYPVERDELPVVMRTEGKSIRDKITDKLVEMLLPALLDQIGITDFVTVTTAYAKYGLIGALGAIALLLAQRFLKPKSPPASPSDTPSPPASTPASTEPKP